MDVKEINIKFDALKSSLNSNKKSLEEYWRAVYPLVLEKKDESPCMKLFFEILMEAVSSEPIQLNKDWLKINEPPNSINTNINLHKEGNNTYSGVEFFLKTLEFQISELHKMKNKQLKDEYKYYGIDSETGNRWYNFDPIGILECGLRGFIDNGFKGIIQNWEELGHLIEMGRIYE